MFIRHQRRPFKGEDMRYLKTLAVLFFYTFSVAAFGQSDCQKHLPFGAFPGANQTFCYDGYAVGYSHALKIPVWAAYRLTHQGANTINVDRSDDFRVNPEIPVMFQSDRDDYRGSGYDRGHMAPSGSIDYSQAANSETYFYSNMVPQRPGFNRDGFGHKGVWGFLENEIRDWVREREELYVVSGAIASGQQAIGNGVAIPEAFYKIVVDLETGDSISFLLPHEDDLRGQAESFIASIDRIEEISGLDLFQRIVDEQEARFESRAASGMW